MDLGTHTEVKAKQLTITDNSLVLVENTDNLWSLVLSMRGIQEQAQAAGLQRVAIVGSGGAVDFKALGAQHRRDLREVLGCMCDSFPEACKGHESIPEGLLK